jgi:glycosyltransferase involved in cell wall biosynthesis
MDRKLSILVFGTQMAIGGAQKLLLDQARWFHDHGHRVTAAFFYDKQGLHERWQGGLAFPLLTLSVIGSRENAFGKAWGFVVGLLKLWELLRRGNFDVIETFTYDSNLLALPLAWLAGIPVRIATHHGMIEGFPRWTERLHSWIINAGIASILVSVSNKTLEQAVMAGIKPAHIIVIPNGIPLGVIGAVNKSEVRRQAGLEGEGLLLLSVGRLVYQKGHEFLVQAMPIILGQYPEVQAAVCGDGGLHDALATQIADLSLEGSVKLLGNRNDISELLASSDVFVLPSRWEGLPVALLEAMGAGLPVVATHVEGVDEVVQQGLQGLLVPPENTEALAEALLQLMRNAELRSRMGKEARKRVETFYTSDIMCQKYLEVMLDLAPNTIP